MGYYQPVSCHPWAVPRVASRTDARPWYVTGERPLRFWKPRRRGTEKGDYKYERFLINK